MFESPNECITLRTQAPHLFQHILIVPKIRRSDVSKEPVFQLIFIIVFIGPIGVEVRQRIYLYQHVEREMIRIHTVCVSIDIPNGSMNKRGGEAMI